MTDELRAEAERLVDLDDRGHLIEAVTICLRVGKQSNHAMESLRALDMAMVGWVRGDTDGGGDEPAPPVRDGSGRDGSISEGSEVSDLQPVGA